jgi:hypothetical protein
MKSRDGHAKMTSGLLTIDLRQKLLARKWAASSLKDAAKAVHEIEEEPMAVTD